LFFAGEFIQHWIVWYTSDLIGKVIVEHAQFEGYI